MSELVYVKYQSLRRPLGVQARQRAKKRRAEGPVVKKVRAACVERDGHCRYWFERFIDPWRTDVTDCEGPSQWAHLGDQTRAKTRGMAAEQRHTTGGSLMLCRRHHDRYDGRQQPRLEIRPVTKHGADGPLEFSE